MVLTRYDKAKAKQDTDAILSFDEDIPALKPPPPRHRRNPCPTSTMLDENEYHLRSFNVRAHKKLAA